MSARQRQIIGDPVPRWISDRITLSDLRWSATDARYPYIDGNCSKACAEAARSAYSRRATNASACA
jgi:hypothetical protein